MRGYLFRRYLDEQIIQDQITRCVRSQLKQGGFDRNGVLRAMRAIYKGHVVTSHFAHFARSKELLELHLSESNQP